MSCSINGCENGGKLARGYCNKHYIRWRKHGDPLQVKASWETCSIADCGRHAQGRGWCKMHWKRWRTHGDPEYVRPVPAPKPRCAVDECEKPKHGYIYCTKHYQRWKASGDPLIVVPRHPGRNRLDVPSYAGMHKRLFYDRGRASKHACVTCGNPAHEWSYSGNDPDEMRENVRGSVVAYSVDQSHYSPRCRPCHRRMDESLVRDRDDSGQFIPTARKRYGDTPGITIHDIREDQ